VQSSANWRNSSFDLVSRTLLCPRTGTLRTRLKCQRTPPLTGRGRRGRPRDQIMISPYIRKGERKISLAESCSTTRGCDEKRGKRGRREVKNILVIFCKLLGINGKIFRAVLQLQIADCRVRNARQRTKGFQPLILANRTLMGKSVISVEMGPVRSRSLGIGRACCRSYPEQTRPNSSSDRRDGRDMSRSPEK